MLASITPLGERGRQSTWGVTVTAFLLGATAAGALLGALAGALGSIALGGGPGWHVRLAILAGLLLVAVLLDAAPTRVPGPRRQVNERWLDAYRGWVYGLGFGAQLGLGLTTVVTSAATYVALLAAFLSGDPLWGAAIFGCYGAIRGATPLAAAHVRDPGRLMAMHARIERWRAPVAKLWPAALAIAGIAALAGSIA